MSQEKPNSSASPGPWRWIARGFAQQDLMAANGQPVLVGLGLGEPRNPADATLIASAPAMAEMLRELEYIRVATDRDGGMGPAFCPRCMHTVSEYEPPGTHASGCPLAALLRSLP